MEQAGRHAICNIRQALLAAGSVSKDDAEEYRWIIR